MSEALNDLIVSRIRERGPISAAEFMDLALYHPDFGYYASSARRSGRQGDFFTSVDTGPLFGEMIAQQMAEMWSVLERTGASRFDLVEAGAGIGLLTRDILDAIARHHGELYDRLRVTLVERSAAARQAQAATLQHHHTRLAASQLSLPSRITGLLLANELLDAMPVHVVSIKDGVIREIHVGERDGVLVEVEAEPSDPALLDRLTPDADVMPSSWRGEINLEAERWLAAAAAAIERGFLLLFDYGHEQRELRSDTHAHGTLTTYRGHKADVVSWLSDPGSHDLTAHVNLTAVRSAAREAGLEDLGCVDQTYFLIGLGLAERVPAESDAAAVARRLAAKALILPGSLGSTMKIMAFAKNVGRPSLLGLASGRLT
ncbi:MAG TPA: SAM-dependent methyltransferase [Vicinamibacterales bacterium]|nr:SAM-dependent methyltransferase [Vicinamibacterales bacterium]